ncbi:type II toxin-antitoxin system HipA family toxin [Altererythrobacter confluentis]|uniref:Type II toxin-antitoxin system HipA family toxin n=1 Tax=Allopontixanthobacter confluentis TaxID=1849021 RepID=A0A6L7GM73_9SPHN|nr:type II toxin-antitoxin system HipA family toxin [Allopontixanthobacter confluentis]MXP15741.1 type II toxin-antitoxin system HipA family toxin [Allopontixanthobacter confluentis]
MSRAVVNLWGRQIGAVLWDEDRDVGVFEYTPEFTRSGIEVAPLTMPLRSGVYDFPALNHDTFKGLPGMLADSLPDKFGHALINRWLAEQGRTTDSFNPVERLCYTGRRGMGALEFEPSTGERREQGGPVDIAPLVELANRVLAAREELTGVLQGDDDHHALQEILRVGTSAGGARAKAVLAWNEETGQFHSGQLTAGPGYTQWLVKFDGVSGNADKELADPMGFGRLEYACYLLAKEAGVAMARSRLHEEGGRAHFMTQRFDRTVDGKKLHMQSLCAMRHFDFNQARAYSYEQAIETIRMLGLGREAIKEQVRRALFNVFIRNQDDHTKNIAFLMDSSGRWSLSPAFDVVYAYNPNGDWTNEHQMSLSGKTDQFDLDDLIAFGRFADLKPAETKAIISDIQSAILGWTAVTREAGVSKSMAEQARNGFRSL